MLFVESPPTVALGHWLAMFALSSEAYVHAALCLKEQLRLVRSVCPLLLVVEDSALSIDARQLLAAAYGDHLLPLRSLTSRARPIIDRVRQRVSLGGRKPWLAGKLTRPVDDAGTAVSHDWGVQSLQKVWLWALPPERFSRLVFLDLDIHVRANLDGAPPHPGCREATFGLLASVAVMHRAPAVTCRRLRR